MRTKGQKEMHKNRYERRQKQDKHRQQKNNKASPQKNTEYTTRATHNKGKETNIK